MTCPRKRRRSICAESALPKPRFSLLRGLPLTVWFRFQKQTWT